MDKNTTFYISLVLSILLLSGTWVAYGILTEAGEVKALSPSNRTSINANNSSALFNLTLNMTLNTSASVILVLNDTIVASNSTVLNNTLTTFYPNQSFTDGYYVWYMNITNGTQTVKTGIRDLVIDTTTPLTLTLENPSAEYNSSSASVNVNVSGFDNLGDVFNNKMIRFNITISGAVNKTLYTWANNTNVGFNQNYPDGLYQWNATIIDNATNTKTSTSSYFRVDTTAPTLGTATAVMVNGSATTSGNRVARVNFTSIDAQLPIHTAYAYVYINGTKTLVLGTLLQNTTGTSIMNQLDIYANSIPYDGRVIIEPGANDTLGNTKIGTNITNFTKVSLYTGWNLIQVQGNNTLEGIKNMSSEITLVSKYNGTYNTYTYGAATHATAPVTDGDAVYVYSKSNIGLLQRWGAFDAGLIRNVSVSTGWNLMSAHNSSIQLYNLCREPYSNTSSTSVIKAVSFYENSVYYSQVCSIATGWNNNLTVTRGKGYWLNVNESVWMIRSRTTEGA